jgi:hypothetical protein
MFASTYLEAADVVSGPLRYERDGQSAAVDLGDAGRVEFAPLRNSMNDEPVTVRWVKPGGFLWRDGDTVKTVVAEARAGEVAFQYADSWGVFSDVAYNAPWPDPVIRTYED